MKSEIVGESQEKQEWKFPCLAIHKDGTIVLFIRDCVGTLVVAISDEKGSEGVFLQSWNMSNFKLLPKSTKVILQND